MMIHCAVIVFTILYFLSLPLKSDYLSSTIQGSLTEDWNFNFAISVKKLDGIILYCIDSDGIQIGIEIKRGDLKKKLVYITYNSLMLFITLQSLCGCDPCENTSMKFDLRFYSRTFSIRCNDGNNMGIINVEDKDKIINKNDSVLYPIPKEIAGRRHVIYIMVGNIGPYYAVNGEKVNPLKIRMTGCLGSLYYNNVRLNFTPRGKSSIPMCPLSCTNNICQDGVCQLIYAGIVCNCSLATFNGLYCNNRLVDYIRGGSNSYEKADKFNYMYMKLTWGPISQSYCLMEIVHNLSWIIISIINDRLFVNQTDIGYFNPNIANFLSIKLTGNSLRITTKDAVHDDKFVLLNNSRINIGFSEKDLNYKAFQGLYDVYFDASIRKINVSEKEDNYEKETEPFPFVVKVAMVIGLFILGVMVFVAVILFFCIRKIIENGLLRNKKDKVEITMPKSVEDETTFSYDDDTYDTFYIGYSMVRDVKTSSKKYHINDTLPPVPLSPNIFTDY